MDTQLLLAQLAVLDSLESKLMLLENQESVKRFLANRQNLSGYLSSCSKAANFILKSLIVIEQGDALFGDDRNFFSYQADLEKLISDLADIELFYQEIGGLIGYHAMTCRLMQESPQISEELSPPPFTDLRASLPLFRSAMHAGFDAMPHLAEIYVAGGAAERLAWKDGETGASLPAASLPFMGRTLLEGLVRDLEAREYSHYKLCGKQLTTPIAVMTSREQNNHEQIEALCSSNNWFGRKRDSWLFFRQSLVPLIAKDGRWCVKAPCSLYFKPGGHGLLWKLAGQGGIFEALWKRGYTKVLVRQINNPLGDTDGGLLALAGIGWTGKKEFGFLSCPRLVGTAEGIDILVEKREGSEVRYAITNVEYTSFKERQFEGKALLANTNLLYADLHAVQRAVKECPFPGLLVNPKSRIEGYPLAGRLETMMQNIADVITSQPMPLGMTPTAEQLPSFVVCRERNKTISVTKRIHKPGESIEETPDGAYYTFLLNCQELFSTHCRMEVHGPGTQDDYLNGRWGFLAYFHPALGPSFEVIGQKIRGGILEKQAELELEISEVDIEELSLKGSLRILADSPLGHVNGEGLIHYSAEGGKCTLHHVRIENKGIDVTACKPWCRAYQRLEECTIILHGNGEFYANNVTLKGAQKFEVMANTRMIVLEENGKIRSIIEPLQSASWNWRYFYAHDDRICVEKCLLS